jgi:hypothetical protein
MKRASLIQYSMLLLITLILISCSPTGAPGPTSAPSSTQAAAYSDPFAYCAAIGTIDEPDARYVGPKVPEVIAKSLMKATNASPDAPLDIFMENSFWRCMDGKVYGCFVGANLPCMDKADTSRTPTPEEADFCKANPNAENIPAYVTGRETVYEWRCRDGTPEIVRQLFKPDARGFISDFWYELSPN